MNNSLEPPIRYPIPANPFVSDYAGLLNAIEENRIQGLLLNAREKLGVEGTVVTVKNRNQYGNHANIESFASGIFYRWDLSPEAHATSLMMVVAKENRELRIEVGRTYPTAIYQRMQPIIERFIIPRFREGDYATGIERGLEQLLLEIRLYRDGETPTLATQTQVALLRAWSLVRYGDWRAWTALGLLWLGAALLGGYRYWRWRNSGAA